jgi:hypothetical protein
MAVASAAGAMAATLFGGAAAWAAPAQHLPWQFPASVTSGQPVSVASIRPCPPPPNPGDPVLVQVNLGFGAAGGSGQVFEANPDGSWSGSVTFVFSDTPSTGTISATCEDFVGFTANPYANYQTHGVTLQSS